MPQFVIRTWWQYVEGGGKLKCFPELCEYRTDNLLCEDFLQDWKKELLTQIFGGIFDCLQNHVMLDGWAIANEQ